MQVQPRSERRAEPRRPAAFGFWYRRQGALRWKGAWMLDRCSGGAAMLVDSQEAPPVGTRLELRPMFSRDRMVSEACPALPPTARVIRHDHDDGTTRRVALRFDLDCPVLLDPLAAAESKRARRGRRTPPPTPPVGVEQPGTGQVAAFPL